MLQRGVATLPLIDPVAVVRDAEGRTYLRDFAAERALALEVGAGTWMEQVSELFLIGDEDIWLHAPPTLLLPAS